MRWLNLSGLLVFTAAGVSAAPYNSAYDQAAGYGVETLENRVERLEKKFSGQGLPKMLGDLEKLQNELLKLRGELEKANHELERLKKQQKDDYTNLDQRLQQALANQTATPAPGTPPTEPAAPAGEGQTPGTQTQPGAPPDAPGRTTAAPPAAEPAPPPPREVAYQKAFATLKDGRYGDAVKEFKSFIGAYPSGEFSDNAHYWLAEAQYVTKDYEAARLAFEQVIRSFPQSPKVADAMLKIGFIDYDRGFYPEARTELADVVKRYPGSSAAKLAEKRLDRMQQEGR